MHATVSAVKSELARDLGEALKGDSNSGQPMVYEQEYSTGKLRVNVVWDRWAGVRLEDRSATILRAYELAEGLESRDRVALASGLTVPEATAAGMLPFQIIPALRKGDPLTSEEVREAMQSEGASALAGPGTLQLRFATREEAEACRQRLIQRFPGSDDVWLISQDLTVRDELNFTDMFTAEVE
jgi:hypothetical protein